MRIGHGFDVHKFGGEGPVIIGGVAIPYEQGLIAHSDGDVALHALCDALLGLSPQEILVVTFQILMPSGKERIVALYFVMCTVK